MCKHHHCKHHNHQPPRDPIPIAPVFPARDVLPVNQANPALRFVSSSRSKGSFSLVRRQLALNSMVLQSVEEQTLSGRDDVIFDKALAGQDDRGSFILSYNEDGTTFSIMSNGRYSLTFQGTVRSYGDGPLRLEFSCGAAEEDRAFYYRDYDLRNGEIRDVSNTTLVPLYAGDDLRIVISGVKGLLTAGSRLIVEKRT